MIGGGWQYPTAFLVAFMLATLATPAGVSGAVLLLPFQVTVLGTPSPAVTPTNLLYNIVATPGALYRYRRNGQSGGVLTRLLLAGTVPGVVAGSVIRVTLLPSARAFDGVIAAVLVPLGLSLWRRLGRQKRSAGQLPHPAVVAIAAVVGTVGGIYGVGGGSILAPLLVSSGRPVSEVAPATLASTFVASVVGVATFVVLSLSYHGSVAPDWITGAALGTGGLAGGYLGARIQPRMPETVIRRILGILVILIGVRYGWLATR